MAFSDPSAADPGGQCPASWEMLGSATTGCVGTNVAGGCIHLCGQREPGAPAITHLGGIKANGRNVSCPAGSKPLKGVAASGAYKFDARGGGITLCVTTHK